MPFKRYITDSMVEPNLSVKTPSEAVDNGEPPDKQLMHYRRACKEGAIEALVDLLARSGQIRNVSKFAREFKMRENASTSAIGNGIAIPHLRSMQPRRLVVAVARSPEGIEFLSPDDRPVHLFFCLTTPPYDDKVYLRFHKWVATEIMSEGWLIGALMQAATPHDMVKVLRGLYY